MSQDQNTEQFQPITFEQYNVQRFTLWVETVHRVLKHLAEHPENQQVVNEKINASIVNVIDDLEPGEFPTGSDIKDVIYKAMRTHSINDSEAHNQLLDAVNALTQS